MTNKTTIVFIGFSLIVVAIGLIINFLTPPNQFGDILINVGLSIGKLLGLIMLLRNGTTIGTLYFKIIFFGIGLTIIGTMFKIMHWPGANIILSVSLSSIALTYVIRFVNKKQKERLDILKLLWVVTAYLGAAIIIQHWIPKEINYITNGLLWLTIIDFVATKATTKTLFEK